jgi:hypothetical protein
MISIQDQIEYGRGGETIEGRKQEQKERKASKLIESFVPRNAFKSLPPPRKQQDDTNAFPYELPPMNKRYAKYEYDSKDAKFIIKVLDFIRVKYKVPGVPTRQQAIAQVLGIYYRDDIDDLTPEEEDTQDDHIELIIRIHHGLDWSPKFLFNENYQHFVSSDVNCLIPIYSDRVNFHLLNAKDETQKALLEPCVCSIHDVFGVIPVDLSKNQDNSMVIGWNQEAYNPYGFTLLKRYIPKEERPVDDSKLCAFAAEDDQDLKLVLATFLHPNSNDQVWYHKPTKVTKQMIKEAKDKPYEPEPEEPEEEESEREPKRAKQEILEE